MTILGGMFKEIPMCDLRWAGTKHTFNLVLKTNI